MKKIIFSREHEGPTTPPSIDWTVLEDVGRLSQDRISMVCEMVQLFERNAGRRADDLYSTIRLRDSREVCRTSHVLKSSSAYIGAIRLQKICDQITLNANAENFREAEKNFFRVVAEMENVIALLRDRYSFYYSVNQT